MLAPTDVNSPFRFHIIRSLFVIALLGTMVSTVVRAEDFQVVGATMIGGAGVLVRTNGTDVQYSTQLSDDKQHLTVRISNAGIRSEQREWNSPRGLIESCFLQQSGHDAVLTVYFRHPAGFTAVLLPYSRSIQVDIFEWNSIGGSEDQYRSGLLALQNHVMSVAKELLFAAAEAKHPDATAFAGFLSVKEGNYDAAKSYFLQALERKSTNADIYGGLAQVSRAQSDDIKARDYEKLFVERNGRPPYYDSQVLKILPLTANVGEPASLSSITRPSTKADSLAAQTAGGQKGTDTVASYLQQLHSMQGKTSAGSNAPQNVTQTQTFGSWANSAILGVGLALLFIGFIFLRGFLQWKKQQLTYLQRLSTEQQQQGRFGSDLQTAMAVSDQQASNVYKRNAFVHAPDTANAASGASVATERTATAEDQADELSGLQSLQEAAAHAVQQRQKTKAEPKTEDSSAELFDFDESFYAKRESSRPRSTEKATEHSPSPSTPAGSTVSSPLYNTPGQPQLSNAETPAFEQQPNNASGGAQILDVDAESLEALAKQLGVDPSLLSSVRGRQSAKKVNS